MNFENMNYSFKKENKIEAKNLAPNKEVLDYLKNILDLKENDVERIELLKAKDLSLNYKKQLEFMDDKRLADVNIALIPDDLWRKGQQPSESDAENNMILIKESYFKAKEKSDKIAWLTHELGHCQAFLDSKDPEDYQKDSRKFAFPDLESEYSYPNNLVEQKAFTKQFQFLKDNGKNREEIIKLISDYYGAEDLPFFQRILDDVFTE